MTKSDNKIGRWGAVSYIIGNIIGSGIFIVPGNILKNTGSIGLFLIIWLLSALIATLGAYCYCELGTNIRRSGGDFAYLTHVKWNSIAFMFMFCTCILTLPLTISIQAETFAEYFLQIFNIKICSSSKLEKIFLIKFIGYGLCWLLIFINFFSLRTFASRFQIICSSAKILAILLIIGIGFYIFIFNDNYFKLNFSQPFANSNFDISLIVNALFSALFSYDGWDILNFGAEEIKNLKQTLFFAMPVGIILVAFLYIFVNLAFLIVIPINEIKDSVTILFSNLSMGILKPLLPFLICIMLIGSLNSTLFVASRYMLAAASKGQLPTFLYCINLKNDSPRVALIFQVILAFIFSFLNSFDKLIGYVSFIMWTQRLFTICALIKIKLFYLNKLNNNSIINIPIIFPFIFLIFILFLVGVTIFKDFNTSSIGLYILAISLILFYLFIWEKSPLLKSSKFIRIFNYLNEKLFIFTQIIFNGNQINFEEKIN